MYVFHVGDGVDTITDTATTEEGNIIYFADASISTDDIRTNLDGTTLTIQYDNQGDAIKLLNFDYSAQHVVETIEFADNTQVPLISFVDLGTEGDDLIKGTDNNDFINGKGGNDTLLWRRR